MSNIAIQGGATGTAVFTIESPTTNTNRTLTLPDEAGTVLTSAGVPTSAMPTGSVLQVVQGVTTTEVDTTSATHTDTGLSASITPTFASSKILVIVHHGEISKTADTGCRIAIKLLRDATEISFIASGLAYTASAINNRVSASMSYLDSPATTSALTYKTTCANPDATGTGSLQVNGSMATITLMEVAA
jgi:hypothetical protein